MTTSPSPQVIDAAETFGIPHGRARARIGSLLAEERERWTSVSPALAPVVDSITALVDAGGKGLRPALCYWSYVGQGGDPCNPELQDLCAALELIHTFALMHDDIIDESSHRRGVATAHRRLATDYAVAGDGLRSDQMGKALAIVAGDLALSLADGLMSSLPSRVRAFVTTLKCEMCLGQSLDIVLSAHPSWDMGEAMDVARFKTAKYSVEGPLLAGALLADASEEAMRSLSAFGVPLGLAFQLKDDILDVTGDPAVTGKPVGQDIAEGKMTALACLAHQRRPEDAIWHIYGSGSVSSTDLQAFTELLRGTDALEVTADLVRTMTQSAIKSLDSLQVQHPASVHLRNLAASLSGREC